MVGRIRPPFIFLAGLLFCVGLVILPEVIPAVHGREGYVWSPVHSQNYRLGDLYYYGAWLKEVLDAGLPAYSPSAGELSGQPLIETWRFLGLALGAIPGYLVSDMRFVILIDYGLSAALFFTIGYLFTLMLARSHWLGLLTGISVLFLTDRLWVPVGGYAGNILGFWRIPASMFSLVIHYFSNIQAVIDYDLIGSTFRFINISLSGPIILLYYLIATLAYKKCNIKIFVILCLITPLMAFAYPSHMLIGNGLIAAYALISLYRRNWKGVVAFASIEALNLVFLETIKYRQMLRSLLDNSQLWNNLFASEKMVLVNHDIAFLVSIVLTGKYLLSFLLMLFLTRKNQFLRDVVVGTGLIAVPLSGIYLFNMPQLSTRFLSRGMDHPWFMLMTVVVLSALYEKIKNSNMAGNMRYTAENFYRWTLKGALAVVFAIIISFSGYAFGHIASHTSTNNSRFIPGETMNAYRWIDKNLPPKAEVATLDWEDITLLPVFTKVNLVVGHNVIDGRSLEDELKRYLALWKFIGLGRQEFERILERGPRAMRSLCTVSAYERVPVLSDEDFNAAQFMNGILYWPHINKMNNMTIVNGRDMTPEFKHLVLNVYDRMSASDCTEVYRARYLVLNNEQARSFKNPGKFRLLHKTGTRVIYALFN